MVLTENPPAINATEGLFTLHGERFINTVLTRRQICSGCGARSQGQTKTQPTHSKE